MADKDATLIIVVCGTCCTKIQNVLCKMKEKEKIKSFSYDTKKNEITITGSFNADQLYSKLRCKVGCCIKGRKDPPKKEEKKEKPAVAATANATVNMQFTQVCVICYPWPCKDPSGHCQSRRCEGPTNVQCPPKCPPACPPKCPPTCPPTCNTCVGPSRCGGCGSCGDGGCGKPPICCPGPSCGGCKGCRFVHEQNYQCHEYPPSACIVM